MGMNNNQEEKLGQEAPKTKPRAGLATEQSRSQEVEPTDVSLDIRPGHRRWRDHGKLRKLDNRHDDSPGFCTRWALTI
jgi:hypothetical protein